VTYDKQRLNAYIHSQTLTLPREDSPMRLTLAKGIRSSRGGDGTAKATVQTFQVKPYSRSLKLLSQGAPLDLDGERKIDRRELSAAAPGKPVYDSVDLNIYLREQTHSKLGIFIVKMSGLKRFDRATYRLSLLARAYEAEGGRCAGEVVKI